MKFNLVSCLALGVWLAFASPSLAAHGISLDGKLKYPANFSQFDYTSPQAVKGGKLLLHDLGSFDKMNPFTLKGTAPAGLDSLLFESLAVSSLDEPFAKYGLLAEDISLAQDGLSVTFTLNPKARFSDDSPVRPEDVKFSLETLKSEAAHPSYQTYFQDVSRAEVLDKQRVRIHFAKVNRELHLIVAEMPILSEKFYRSQPFASSSMTPPVGSGPYVVGEFQAGKSITYRRNEKYWGANQPTRKGMFNFDTITYQYYKDQLVAVEAFKAHEFDFMHVNIAKQWARDLDGPKFAAKQIVKETLAHKNNAGMQGFVFNLRRPLFADRRVRQALGLAFDFEWTNKSLFFEQYTQNHSYFANSVYQAEGVPQGLELEYLNGVRDKVPAEVFTLAPAGVSTAPPHSLRDNLRQAQELLKEAGWVVKEGKLVKAKEPSQVFQFEILLAEPTFERVMAPYVKNLQKLGIEVGYRTIDPALFTRRMHLYDFDMTVHTFGQSQSPGNEQREYWSSATADREGARNIIGIKEPAVDGLVEKIIYAKSQEELTAAARALDRVLWYGYYVVPNWYVAQHRVVYWNNFVKPDKLPLFYHPNDALMTWWNKK